MYNTILVLLKKNPTYNILSILPNVVFIMVLSDNKHVGIIIV